MAKKDLTVYAYEADGEIRIFPPVITLDATGGGPTTPDEIDLVNATDEDLFWFVPANLLGANEVAEPVAKNKKTGKKAPNKTTANNVRKGAFIVIGQTTGRKGKGNSDPVIIIEN